MKYILGDFVMILIYDLKIFKFVYNFFFKFIIFYYFFDLIKVKFS